MFDVLDCLDKNSTGPESIRKCWATQDSPAGKVKAVHAGPVKYGLSERDEYIQKSGFELAA